MKLSLIVAMSRNGVIGDKGGLPWDCIPEDMRNFRKLTMGKPCIMGRKTWNSIGGVLERRRNIILSRTLELSDAEYVKPIYFVRTPAEAIVEAFGKRGADEAFVIGGAEIYRLFWPLCEEAHVTTVKLCGDQGDTCFPYVFEKDEWEEVEDMQLTPEVRYQKLRRIS